MRGSRLLSFARALRPGHAQQRLVLAAASGALALSQMQRQAWAEGQVPSNRPQASQEQASSLLPHSRDRYNGIVIEAIEQVPDEVFAERLQASLEQWRQEGRRGVWLKIPIQQSQHIPKAVDLGFRFHHAEPTYCMLCTWLPKDEPCTLPANASHSVGVGAAVINGRGELLVVQEATGPAAGRGLWKVPTGLVDVGEDLVNAAIREVREETGVATVFESLLCFRQSHGGPPQTGGKSDLFFLMRLRPASETEEGLKLHPCEREIAEARWMPVREFLAKPLPPKNSVYHAFNVLAAHSAGIEDLQAVEDLGLEVLPGHRYQGLAGHPLPLGFRPGSTWLFYAGVLASSS